MDQLKEFMLDAWRATGRHTDIATLTTHIAQLLGHWVPVQQVLVRRIEPERGCIETVGVGPDSLPLRPLGDRSDCAHAPSAAPPGLVPLWEGDTVASWWQGRQDTGGC